VDPEIESTKSIEQAIEFLRTQIFSFFILKTSFRVYGKPGNPDALIPAIPYMKIDTDSPA
jgi:hypothetical protein